MGADFLPEVFELPSGNNIGFDVISYSHLCFIKIVVILVGTDLFLSINVYFSDRVAQRRLNFGLRIWFSALSSIEDEINKLLLTTPYRISLSKRNYSFHLQVVICF